MRAHWPLLYISFMRNAQDLALEFTIIEQCVATILEKALCDAERLLKHTEQKPAATSRKKPKATPEKSRKEE